MKRASRGGSKLLKSSFFLCSGARMISSLIFVGLLHLIHASDLDTVSARFATSLLPKDRSEGESLANEVNGILAKFISSNCTFEGIDYNSKRRASWPVMAHLSYTQAMLAGWRSNQTGSLHNNATVRNAGVCALNWWLVHKPECPNWYDQVISGPNNIGQAVLYLGAGSLPQNQTDAADALMNKAAGPWTGSNLLFVLRAQILRGLFLKDADHVGKCFSTAYGSLVLSNQGDDGIQADGSFHQHGPQLLAAHTYGSEFSNHVLEMTMLSADTQWQPADGPLANFAGLVLDGQQHMVRAQSDHWDWQAAGRSVDTPPGHLTGVSSSLVPSWMRSLADRPRGDEWVAFADRLDAGSSGAPLVATKVYWDSDFATHATKDFSMSIHMHSKRTIGGACVNEQGKLSQRMSDGTMAVYHKGDEYDGVWPVLDYMRPPGTTTAMNGEELGCGNAKKPTYSGCTFVGGVASNSSAFGALAMDLHYDKEIHAPRSWMLIPEGSIMLGQSLQAAAGEDFPLATTMDQRLLAGDVWIGTHLSGGKPVKLTKQGNFSYGIPGATSDSSLHFGDGSIADNDILQWVWHDGTGYVLLGDSMGAQHDTPPTSAQLFVGPKTGDWSRVGVESGNVTLDMLDLAMYHANDAAQGNGTFAYAVLPTVSSPSDMQSAIARFTTQPAAGRDDQPASADGKIRVIRPVVDGAFAPWHAVLHDSDATMLAVIWDANAPPAAAGLLQDGTFTPVSAGAGWSIASSVPTTVVVDASGLDSSGSGTVLLSAASPGIDGGKISLYVDRALSACTVAGTSSVSCVPYSPPASSRTASLSEASTWTQITFELPGGDRMVGAPVSVRATS